MPTYDYECSDCGHRFELFQSMSAKLKRKCPECGKPKLQRLIGPGAGFLFKGDGFYTTDYRSESYKAGEKAGEKAAGDKGAGDKGAGEKGAGDKGATSGDAAGGDKKSSSNDRGSTDKKADRPAPAKKKTDG